MFAGVSATEYWATPGIALELGSEISIGLYETYRPSAIPKLKIWELASQPPAAAAQAVARLYRLCP